VAKWRREQALLRTLERRPEILEGVNLTAKEKAIIEEAKRK
jgi:tRNA (guanine37-N1)-methyltransferase